MSFWSFFKWMLSKKQRPVFPADGYSLYYDKTGDAKLLSLNCWEPGPNNFALWLELMARLMEERPCATMIEQWNYDRKREINKSSIAPPFPLFALERLPDCRTLAEAKACIGQPGLFALEYDICEDWADITLPDEETQAFAVKTIQKILSAHGKTLCVLDAES